MFVLVPKKTTTNKEKYHRGPTSCKICGMALSRMSALKRHMKKIHKSNKLDETHCSLGYFKLAQEEQNFETSEKIVEQNIETSEKIVKQNFETSGIFF